MKDQLRSFAGGVITPEMFGRLDMTRYQTGLAIANNFHILPHGPAQNRAGTEYVLEVKDSTQPTLLIPFVYSTTDAAILELGNLYMRVHVLGGTVLEANVNVTNVTQGVPGVVTANAHGYSNGQEIFPASILGMVNINNRPLKVAGVTTNTFQLQDLAGNPLDTTGYPAYTGGGTVARVYEMVTPYVTADLFDLHFTQDSDVLSIAHPNYPPSEIRRLGATNWTFTNIKFVPTALQPVNAVAVAGPASGAKKERYMVTAVVTDGLEESLGIQPAINGAVAGVAITAFTNANPGLISAAAHGRSIGDNVTMTAITGMLLPNGNSGVNALDLRVGTVPTAGSLTLVNPDGSPFDTTALTAYAGGGLLFLTDITNDLTVAGNTNTISWPGSGVTVLRYNVYKNRNGIYGYIGQTNQNSFVDQNITQNEAAAPPLLEDAFTGVGNWPTGIGYFQGRRWFTGTNNKKQNAWATRSGTESNMTYSLPSQDNDRLSFKLKSRQANTIRHVVPMNTLVFLTSSGEWRIAASTGDTLTPATIDPIPDAAVGSSNVQPIVTNTACLYSQDRGARVRELQFSWENQGYATDDKSIMTPQFFDNFTITQMTFQRSPNPFGWFVRSDGTLLGFTYVPDQQINAWHSHTFAGGFVESVAVIPEGKEDFLYLIVRRTMQGRTVRSVERLHSRLFVTLPDCYFTDCGFSYTGASISVVNFGLWHLEGQMVSILGDGATHPPQTVTNGAVTLQSACSKIAIGIKITAQLQTLPIALELQAMGQGTMKNISKAYVRVANSSSLKIGPAFNKLRELKQRKSENMGTPPNVMNDEEPIDLTPQWDNSGQVCIQQDEPLPMTVLSMVFDVAVGG